VEILNVDRDHVVRKMCSGGATGLGKAELLVEASSTCRLRISVEIAALVTAASGEAEDMDHQFVGYPGPPVSRIDVEAVYLEPTGVVMSRSCVCERDDGCVLLADEKNCSAKVFFLQETGPPRVALFYRFFQHFWVEEGAVALTPPGRVKPGDGRRVIRYRLSDFQLRLHVSIIASRSAALSALAAGVRRDRLPLC